MTHFGPSRLHKLYAVWRTRRVLEDANLWFVLNHARPGSEETPMPTDEPAPLLTPGWGPGVPGLGDAVRELAGREHTVVDRKIVLPPYTGRYTLTGPVELTGRGIPVPSAVTPRTLCDDASRSLLQGLYVAPEFHTPGGVVAVRAPEPEADTPVFVTTEKPK